MKKKKTGLFSSGLKLYASSVAVGAMPNPTGNANIDSIKSNVMGGIANYSKAYPAVGKLAGTGLVLKQIKKFKKIRI